VCIPESLTCLLCQGVDPSVFCTDNETHTPTNIYSEQKRKKETHVQKDGADIYREQKKKRKTETYLHSMADRGRKRHKIREVIQIEKKTVTYLPRRRDRERNRRTIRDRQRNRDRNSNIKR
jgi:hypothetical protein